MMEWECEFCGVLMRGKVREGFIYPYDKGPIFGETKGKAVCWSCAAKEFDKAKEGSHVREEPRS